MTQLAELDGCCRMRILSDGHGAHKSRPFSALISAQFLTRRYCTGQVGFREQYSRSDIDLGKADLLAVAAHRLFETSDEPFAPARGSGFTVPMVSAP